MADDVTPGEGREQHDAVMRDRIELVATVLLALATVLTAWSAFESTKWSGTQATHFARASALRTDSAKEASTANAQEVVDVDVFVSWASAVAQERQRDPNASIGADGIYQPDPAELSGFLFERFRDEFQPAIKAWLAMHPLEDPEAAPTPFSLPEYHLAARQRSEKLAAGANVEAALARRDNQRGDNYVLTTVLFASVLFFAGVSTKLGSTRNRMLTVGLAVLVLIAGMSILFTFPVQI